jgi:hypothetical protein
MPRCEPVPETSGMASAFVYLPGARLSQAELSAACLDGDLVAIGDAFAPADVVESPALRAASLAGLVGDTLAVTHLSAAWVHGALDIPPSRHTLQRAVDRRLHHVIDRRFVYRDRVVAPADLERRGGVLVTSVGRTLADLARSPAPDHADAIAAWSAFDPDAVARAIAWVDARPRLPHGRRARTILEAVRTT